MKAYIQYVDISPVTGGIYEPCGDRSVLILDGRNNLETWIEDGHKYNGFHRPKYHGFKIMRGDFRQSTCIYSTLN